MVHGVLSLRPRPDHQGPADRPPGTGERRPDRPPQTGWQDGAAALTRHSARAACQPRRRQARLHRGPWPAVLARGDRAPTSYRPQTGWLGRCGRAHPPAPLLAVPNAGLRCPHRPRQAVGHRRPEAHAGCARAARPAKVAASCHGRCMQLATIPGGLRRPRTPRPPAGGRARAAGPVPRGHARHGLPARPGCLTAPGSARRGSRHRPAALSEHGLPAAPNRRARGPYHGPRCPPGGLSRAAGLRPGWRRGKLPRLALARPASPPPPRQAKRGCGSRERP
jgi:hypothetical protein